MAYSTSNPPICISGPAHGAGQKWRYSSTDAAATVVASGYFTNGKALGIRAGDIFEILDNDSTYLQTSSAVVVSVSAAGVVDLSDAVSIGGAANAG